MNSVSWTSAGGVSLSFDICAPSFAWPDVPGIYMFCRRSTQGTWEPVYVGQAASFKSRLCSHEQWDPAARLGATAILAVIVRAQRDRDAIEETLIRELQPGLNTQLRHPPWLGGLPGLLGRA